jgi:hypothetical protein
MRLAVRVFGADFCRSEVGHASSILLGVWNAE